MFKNFADLIKRELLRNTTVQVELSWRLDSPQGRRVEYELWSSPSDPHSLDILSNFNEVAMSLGERAHFTPHFYLYHRLENDDCYGEDCYHDGVCTNYGRYCIFGERHGTEIVTEMLRRLCIWNEYGAQDGIGVKWWEYVSLFNDRCFNSSTFAATDCNEDIMERVGIDAENVRRCIRDSGGLEANAANALLQKELELQSERGIYRVPTLTVNGYALEGARTTSNVFDAICGAFSPDDEPEICHKCFGCKDVSSCVRNNGICDSSFVFGGNRGESEASKSTVSTVTFVLSLLLATMAFGTVGFLYYKRSQAEMRRLVSAIVTDYLPLEDEDEREFQSEKSGTNS